MVKKLQHILQSKKQMKIGDSQLMASIMVEEKKLPMMVIYQMDLNVV
jgi:hypothetical protein